MSAPFSINGRSPVDDIRLRWSGLACVALGVLLVFQGPVGIVFGILVVALGVATWVVTRLGRVPWQQLTKVGKAIAGTTAAIGIPFFLMVALTWVLVLGMLAMFASWFR